MNKSKQVRSGRCRMCASPNRAEFELLWSSGKISYEDIGRDLGITKQAVYYHFKKHERRPVSNEMQFVKKDDNVPELLELPKTNKDSIDPFSRLVQQIEDMYKLIHDVANDQSESILSRAKFARDAMAECRHTLSVLIKAYEIKDQQKKEEGTLHKLIIEVVDSVDSESPVPEAVEFEIDNETVADVVDTEVEKITVVVNGSVNPTD